MKAWGGGRAGPHEESASLSRQHDWHHLRGDLSILLEAPLFHGFCKAFLPSLLCTVRQLFLNILPGFSPSTTPSQVVAAMSFILSPLLNLHTSLGKLIKLMVATATFVLKPYHY